ncbi:M20/M25/M40 family metallo-hydrolase [Acidimicrobiaceae bacterium]|nr:M20/M25/M40 family metallo-hydrolase [Acidimicrobiaceae bacterium]MDA9712603.1 M20/M25/M40 family metallo-hydrolase [Acidimicrobiaceae bacterium]
MKNANITELLSKLVEIPSISSLDENQKDVLDSANYIADLFNEIGLNSKVTSSKNSKPAVLAKTEIDPSKKTVLLYAHHDVQPVGDINKWDTDPFTPEIIDGRLFARGSGDNKAGVVIHYEVVKNLLETLPVNIKIFIEGEEEIGSPYMTEFIAENRRDLEADVIVIADSGNIKSGVPTITTSLRGLVDGVIVVDQQMEPVHSGLGGGVVPDAFMILSRIIASFHNDKGELLIEGLTPTEQDVFELSDEFVKSSLSSNGVELFEMDSYSKRLWLEPALSILAIDAPPVAESVNLLIPKAKAKVSLRLPPTEDPDHAMNMLEKHIKENTPFNANVNFIPEAKGKGILVDPKNEFSSKLIESFNKNWENEVAYMGVGGSIPFANVFINEFPNSEIVLVGAGDEEGNAHAPNESVNIDDIKRLITSLTDALSNY